jgi:phosphoribosylformylglycinamidine cyclo-ligase
MSDGGFTYKNAGVDVHAGNEAVRLLRARIRSADNPLVLSGIGGFGGAIGMPPHKDPVLVAGTDGAGTKVMIAKAMERFDTIGIDVVAMSVNDVSACGATPLFFLDYIVVGTLVPEQVAELVAGVDEGCMRAQCVLLGGETAEHPGHFAHDDDFDMGGFAVGVAERGELWGPAKVRAGDVAVALASSGVHANGFSLVRKLLTERARDLREPFPGSEQTLGDVLLTPTLIYSPVLSDLGRACNMHAAAHVTGGGFPDNLDRAVPAELALALDLDSWELPAVFAWLREAGVDDTDMLTTFNCGVGMVVLTPADQVDKALATIAQAGHVGWVVGEIVARGSGPSVRYKGALWR